MKIVKIESPCTDLFGKRCVKIPEDLNLYLNEWLPGIKGNYLSNWEFYDFLNWLQLNYTKLEGDEGFEVEIEGFKHRIPLKGIDDD